MSSDIPKVWLMSTYVTFGRWPEIGYVSMRVLRWFHSTVQADLSLRLAAPQSSFMAVHSVFSLFRRTASVRGRICVVTVLLC
jgi:hypothetical protein